MYQQKQQQYLNKTIFLNFNQQHKNSYKIIKIDDITYFDKNINMFVKYFENYLITDISFTKNTFEITVKMIMSDKPVNYIKITIPQNLDEILELINFNNQFKLMIDEIHCFHYSYNNMNDLIKLFEKNNVDTKYINILNFFIEQEHVFVTKSILNLIEYIKN